MLHTMGMKEKGRNCYSPESGILRIASFHDWVFFIHFMICLTCVFMLVSEPLNHYLSTYHVHIISYPHYPRMHYIVYVPTLSHNKTSSIDLYCVTITISFINLHCVNKIIASLNLPFNINIRMHNGLMSVINIMS